MNLNSQNQFYLLFFTLLGHITFDNNVVVTVLHLLQALHRRIIVYRLLSEIQKLMTHTSEYHCHGTSNLTTKHDQITSINSQTVYYLQGSRDSTVAQPIKQGMIGL